MKKIFLTTGIMSLSVVMFGQTFMTRTGKISFNATTPGSPEKIEGINNEVANIIDAKTGNIVFQLPVKSFKFEKELMQEHFNENYMESDKFPRAEFKGNITNMNEVNFAKDGAYNANVTGKLTIHGVTKDVTVPGTITVTGRTIKASAKFTIKLQDYGVTIPGMVADKVAKEATIQLESDLAQK
jgi:polyisoprenoid-binding protein YceI